MTLLLLSLVVVVTPVAAFAGAWLAGRRRGGRTLSGRTVLVTTASGETIRGTLVARGTDLTLAGAAYVRSGGEVAIDGFAHIPAAAVAWIQEPAG